MPGGLLQLDRRFRIGPRILGIPIIKPAIPSARRMPRSGTMPNRYIAFSMRYLNDPQLLNSLLVEAVSAPKNRRSAGAANNKNVTRAFFLSNLPGSNSNAINNEAVSAIAVSLKNMAIPQMTAARSVLPREYASNAAMTQIRTGISV